MLLPRAIFIAIGNSNNLGRVKLAPGRYARAARAVINPTILPRAARPG